MDTKATGSLRDAAYRLRVLSQAFTITGNEVMAEKIFDISTQIEEAFLTIESDAHHEAQERFREARQASSNVFKAVLAGIAVAVKDTSPETAALLAPENIL